ncbi:MAG: hydrogenase accessory protein HypB, partial [Bacteroidota bacterium]|nr:hydrogenase accessory protein HypB [Bacteroidota bacterium]
IMVVTKTDLLPYVPFSVDAVIKDAKEVNDKIKTFTLSSYKGEGMDEWCDFLMKKLEEKKEKNMATEMTN